jgi:hypothetical protein
MSTKGETPFLHSDLVAPGTTTNTKIAEDIIPVLSWSRGSPYDGILDDDEETLTTSQYGDLDAYFPEPAAVDDKDADSSDIEDLNNPSNVSIDSGGGNEDALYDEGEYSLLE